MKISNVDRDAVLAEFDAAVDGSGIRCPLAIASPLSEDPDEFAKARHN